MNAREVSREELQRLRDTAKEENQVHVFEKLDRILSQYPQAEQFFIELMKPLKPLKPKTESKEDKIMLSGPQLEVTTDIFKNMNVKELRQYTLKYYLANYAGKKIKKNNITIHFFNKAGRKLQKPIYKEKIAVLQSLEELIKKSVYNNFGQRKKTDSKDVIGFLNFKSKIIIDGEKRHVRLSFVVNKKRLVSFKTCEVGTKPKQKSQASLLQPHKGKLQPREAQPSDCKSTTKKQTTQPKTKKNIPKGLGEPVFLEYPTDYQHFKDETETEKKNNPINNVTTDDRTFVDIVETLPDDTQAVGLLSQAQNRTSPVRVENNNSQPMNHTTDPTAYPDDFYQTPTPTFLNRKMNLAHQLANKASQREFFRVQGADMEKFLGDIEKKNKDSVVITLTGGQGSGKTRFAFQFLHALAHHNKVGHVSIEEHPESLLYEQKAMQYLTNSTMQNIQSIDPDNMQQLHEFIKNNDVVVIDSFQKIKEMEPSFEIDKDLRKKYNGKLFLVIFQQTTQGNMRGGSKSQFDGDIVLFTKKYEDFSKNYVYPDKNRYNPLPAHLLRYNIAKQALDLVDEDFFN